MQISFYALRGIFAGAVAAALLILSTHAARAQAVQEYPLDSSGLTGGMAVTADGTVWYSQYSTSFIGGFKSGRNLPPIPTPTIGSGPNAMAVGPDGNVWFLESKVQQLARLDVSTRTISEEPIPCRPSSGIFNAGDALWFAEQCSGYEELVSVGSGGAFSRYVVSSDHVGIFDIVKGPDNNIWFTEANGNAIGRLDLTGPFISEFPLPVAGSKPTILLVGPDGEMWFEEVQTVKLGRFDVAHPSTVDEFDWPDIAMPLATTLGSDEKFWAIDHFKRVWRFSVVGGLVNRDQMPSKQQSVAIDGITTVANGDIWFLEYDVSDDGSALGVIDMDDIFNDNVEEPLP